MDAIINWYNDLMSNEIWFYLIHTLLKLVLMFAVILAFVVLSVWIERRVAGWIQDRPGPNRPALARHSQTPRTAWRKPTA